MGSDQGKYYTLWDISEEETPSQAWNGNFWVGLAMTKNFGDCQFIAQVIFLFFFATSIL
jgi:hypothetical protein